MRGVQVARDPRHVREARCPVGNVLTRTRRHLQGLFDIREPWRKDIQDGIPVAFGGGKVQAVLVGSGAHPSYLECRRRRRNVYPYFTEGCRSLIPMIPSDNVGSYQKFALRCRSGGRTAI